MLLLPLPWGAYVSIPTTIGRRFRHPEHKILWFVYEFFLTSFPQPPILRFQARGRISWLQHFFAAPNQSLSRTGFNRKSKGASPYGTPRLGFLARLSWAFVSFFGANGVFSRSKFRRLPTKYIFVYQYGALHFTLGAPLRSRMKVLLPHGSPAHMHVALLPARRQNV